MFSEMWFLRRKCYSFFSRPDKPPICIELCMTFLQSAQCGFPNSECLNTKQAFISKESFGARISQNIFWMKGWRVVVCVCFN